MRSTTTRLPSMLRLVAPLGLAALLLSPVMTVRAADLYWTEYGHDGTTLFSLHRARIGKARPSCRVQVIPDMGTQPAYAHLVAADRKIYWRDFYGQLMEAQRDGSGIGPAQGYSTKTAFQLIGADLDAAGVHSYWPYPQVGESYPQYGVIRRGDFEGENQVDLLYTRAFQPNMAIALDELDGKIYWAGAWSGGDTGLVQRANLDGTVIETLVGSGLNMDDFPVDLVLDLPNGKMYWINMANNAIQRANLDGSRVENVVTGILPFSIALDPESARCRSRK